MSQDREGTLNYAQERLAEIRGESPKSEPARPPVVMKPRYWLRIVGNGMDSHVTIADSDDMEIVEAILAKLRRDLKP